MKFPSANAVVSSRTENRDVWFGARPWGIRKSWVREFSGDATPIVPPNMIESRPLFRVMTRRRDSGKRLAMFLIPTIDPGPRILTSFRTRDRQAPPRRFIILVLNEAGVNELMMRSSGGSGV